MGLRCEIGESTSNSKTAVTTAVVVVLLIVIVLVLGLMYWWKRCPFMIWKRRGLGLVNFV